MAGFPKLRLQNNRTGKKEPIPPAKVLSLYFPLAPDFHPAPGSPTLGQFPSLTSLRLFSLAGILTRILQLDHRPFKIVGKPGEADLLVFGDPLVTLEPEASLNQAPLVLKVEGIIFKGEGNREGLEVTRDFTLDEFQYLAYGTLYHQPLQISQLSLENARAALSRLKEYITRLTEEASTGKPSQAKKVDIEAWRERFYEQLFDDLNLPRALAVIWTLLQSNLGPADKLGLLSDFDRVLKLGLIKNSLQLTTPLVIARTEPSTGPEDPQNFKKDPAIQKKLSPGGKEKPKEPNRPDPGKFKGPLATGQEGQNSKKGSKGNSNAKTGKPGQNPKVEEREDKNSSGRRRIESSQQVRSFLGEADRFDFTVSLLSHNSLAELRTTVESLLFYITRGHQKVEVVAVDLGSQDGSTEYLDGVAASYANFRVLQASPTLGEAAGRNLAFRQGHGKFMLVIDAGLTLKGDLFEVLFAKKTHLEFPALFGLYPLRLKRENDHKPTGFEAYSLPSTSKEDQVPVEALDGSLLFFRRTLVEEAGYMDERFRLPYALDLDYSFAFHDKGFKVIALPKLGDLVGRPAGFSRPTYNLDPIEQARQREKNWNLFLKSWDL